jgi:hypothetical protein
VGLIFRRRIGGRHAWLNLSRSGISLTGRAGPFTVNSRGGWTARLFRGLFYRGRWR